MYIISDKARTASVLNDLKNDPSDEYISEVILKITSMVSDDNGMTMVSDVTIYIKMLLDSDRESDLHG